mmetsp:Transcript_141846/g.272397  ORF Transcript_141846/g.272397 Transcript_141846/m.272397 type:complete len:289 (+) Transcript_141846:3428-4294(+)
MAHACYLQIIVLLFVLDPHNALQLWIDDQAPSLRVGHDGTIFAGYTVSWQALPSPLRHLGIIREDYKRIWLGTQRHVLFCQVLHVGLNTFLTVMTSEDSNIGCEGASDQCVTRDVHEFLSGVLDCGLPNHSICGEGTDKTLGHVELCLALLRFFHDSILLSHGLIKFLHELCKLSLELSHQCVHLRLPGVCIFKRLCGFPKRLLLGFDLHDHIVVHDDVDDPDTKATCSLRLLRHSGLTEIIAEAILDFASLLHVLRRHLALIYEVLVLFQIDQKPLWVGQHPLRTFP